MCFSSSSPVTWLPRNSKYSFTTTYFFAGPSSSSKYGDSATKKLIISSMLKLLNVQPIMVTASVLVLNLDPLHFCVLDISDALKLSLHSIFALNFLRFSIIAVNAVMICSNMKFVLIVFISSLKIQLNIFFLLLKHAKFILEQRIRFVQRIEFLVKIHLCLKLAGQRGAACQELGSISLLFIGQLILIFSNFATLRFYNVLPFAAYQFYPSVSIVALAIASLTLPVTQKLAENSKEVLRMLDASVLVGGSWNVKALKRKIRSMQPYSLCAVLGGIKICLNRDTKRQYFQTGINYTINLLLGLERKSD